jgi:hypothetical protein
MASQTKLFTPPLRLEITNRTPLSARNAATMLDQFLHQSTAVHLAPKTVTNQLEKLFEEMRREGRGRHDRKDE